MKILVVELILFFLGYQAAGVVMLLVPQPWGIGLGLLLFGWLLRRFFLRRGQAGEVRRWVTLRLRPLGGAPLAWTLAAIPVLLVLASALEHLYLSLIPVPLDSLNPFAELNQTPLQRLAITLLAVSVAPILEEFFFRGVIQRTLERRWPPDRAIGVAAALFAAVHFIPWIFPVHLFLGLAFGFAVYATRSIWSGVLLHAANNSLAVLGMGATDELGPRPTVWETGPDADWWTALQILIVTGGIAAWIARRLWRAGRPARSRERTGIGAPRLSR